MMLFSWAIMTTCESTDASPMLVSPYELDVPGVVVVACFGGILFAMFYRDRGSEYMTKPCGKCHGGLLNGLGM